MSEMNTGMSRRERLRQRRQKAQTRSRLIWGGAIVAVLALVGYLVWNAVRPAQGESVTVMTDISHVSEGETVDYNTNPPSSGPHYEDPLAAGFYDEDSEEASLPHPEGYLVHNLEHGYVIFWYNCEVLDEAGCEQLKADIKAVMDDFNNLKLIAFPWNSIDEPLAMTSWGQLQRFESFNARAAAAFIRANRNRAPEPNAP